MNEYKINIPRLKISKRRHMIESVRFGYALCIYATKMMPLFMEISQLYKAISPAKPSLNYFYK